MKIFSIIIASCQDGSPPILLSSTHNLDDISFWYRSSVKELACFVSKEVLSRSKASDCLSVQHKEYMCHARSCSNGLGVAVLSDEEYPSRVAFTMIDEVLDLFNSSFNESQWRKFTSDTSLNVIGIDELLVKYGKPEETDKIMMIHKELEETKKILVVNIGQLLNRGESLEKLSATSESLSFQSRIFLGEAEKLNSKCCSIL